LMAAIRARLGGLSAAVELAVTVAVAVGIAFAVQALLVKPYRIPSASMQPTIKIGQRILADRLNTHPGLGTIVIFHPPAGADPQPAVCGDPDQGPGRDAPCDQATARESDQTFIKRVVGLPGDRLSIHDGHVTRNGRSETAPYAQACDEPAVCSFQDTITVPADDYYVMGDNRGNSDDSRFWGPVPQRWIIGTALVTYWPLNRIGTF
jgi:signal peptidase I